MADRPGGSSPVLLRPSRPRSGLASTGSSYSFHRRVPHTTSKAQLLVFLALAVTLAALLVLAGVTLTVALVVISPLLLITSPLLLITSPLWAPLALVAIVAVGALLFGFGHAVFALGAGTWAHRHLTGRHPVGAHRVGRFAGAASHGTNHYERAYGRRKDASPGA